MAAPIRQSEYADLLRADLGATDGRFVAMAGALGTRALGWAPPAGGWSIGQVLEHLTVVADSYLTPMRRAIDNALDDAGTAGDPLWRPSFAGWWMARALRAPRKLPAPRSYVPPVEPRPNVLDEFRARQQDYAMLLQRARPLEWTRVRIGSPVVRLIRFNLGDCFTIGVVHARRHLGQIERIRAEPGFPALA